MANIFSRLFGKKEERNDAPAYWFDWQPKPSKFRVKCGPTSIECTVWEMVDMAHATTHLRASVVLTHTPIEHMEQRPVTIKMSGAGHTEDSNGV